MKNIVCDFVTNWENIVELAFANKDEGRIYLLVDVYNQYQENERDYADYIFNINNVNDVCDVLKGGMHLSNLMSIYNERERTPNTFSPLFYVNMDSLPTLLCWYDLKKQLKGYGEEIIENMIMYPHSYDKTAYEIIITSLMEYKNQFYQK